MSLGLNGSSAGASAGPVIGTFQGSEGNKTLTFEKLPKFLVIVGEMYTPSFSSFGYAFWTTGTDYAFLVRSSASSSYSVTVDENSITFPRNIAYSGVCTYIAFF